MALFDKLIDCPKWSCAASQIWH